MASETPSNDPLIDTYERHIGDPTTEDEARGYWLFALGAILGIVGVLLFLVSQSRTGVWDGIESVKRNAPNEVLEPADK